MLGKKIQQLRKENGLSQEELASKLTISRQAVSKWELGESMPDTENVVQLSKLFGVSTDYLLNDEYERDKDAPEAEAEAKAEAEANGEKPNGITLDKQEECLDINQSNTDRDKKSALGLKIAIAIVVTIIAVLLLTVLSIFLLLTIDTDEQTSLPSVVVVDTSQPSNPEVRSVVITYAGQQITDITMCVGEDIPLRVKVEPVGFDGDLLWLVSDENVFDVLIADPAGFDVTLNAISPGIATLSVAVGDLGHIYAECIVRVIQNDSAMGDDYQAQLSFYL